MGRRESVTGERTRHRVLFPAPSPETSRNHLVRWNFMGVLRTKGCRTAGERFGARGGACVPPSDRFALPFGFMKHIQPTKKSHSRRECVALKLLSVVGRASAKPTGSIRALACSGLRPRLPAKEIILVNSNVPKSGGFLPFMILNTNRQAIFETRIFSQPTGRNMVFISPPSQPGERVKIKMLPQLLGAQLPSPADQPSPATR
jgi:hypothetical protein